MTLPFVSADRYDPKKARKHTRWVLKTYREFSGDTQSQVHFFNFVLRTSKTQNGTRRGMHTKNLKNQKKSNYLCDRVSGRKTFLGAN